MKTMTKKLGAIVLALCLCFSLCCTALAASGSGGSITIDGEAGQMYTIYKVFDLTYADDKSSYSYKAVEAWEDFFNDSDLFILDEEGYLDPESAIFSETDNSATMAKLAQDMLAYAFENDIPITDAIGAQDDGTAEFTGLNLGWYLVDTSLGTLCMLTTTDPAAEISEKNDTPTVDKFVDMQKSEAVDNTKTVEYELDIEHITGVSSLILHDHMDMENTVEVTYTFDYDNMTVTLIDGNDETTLTRDVDYVLDTEPDDGCDFHVVFTVDDVDYDFSNVSEEGYIEVDIGCTLVADGASFEDDEIEIPNFAMVSYGLNSASESEWVEADVYEYGFEIFKYTEDEEGVQTALAGATFTLTSYEGTAYFAEANGIYTFEGWDLSDDAAEGLTTNLVSTDSGNILIEGLSEGTYTITEIEAPDGYNKLDYTIEVTITVGTETKDFTVTYTKADGSEVTAEDDVVPIENNQGTVLPGTGGIGTTIFYIIGGVLIVGAVVVLVTRRRMNGSEG